MEVRGERQGEVQRGRTVGADGREGPIAKPGKQLYNYRRRKEGRLTSNIKLHIVVDNNLFQNSSCLKNSYLQQKIK